MKVLSSGFDDPDGAAKLERHHRDALASGSHGTQKVVVLLRPETGIALRHGDVIKACKEEGRPVLGLAWLGWTHRASSKGRVGTLSPSMKMVFVSRPSR